MSLNETIFNTIPKTDYQENLPEINVNEFLKVIETRRSVRVYDGSKVPEEVVRKCLELGLLAPNSSNLQSWEFLWIRNDEIKKEVVKACLSQPAASTAAELIVCLARTDTWKKNAKEMLQFFHSQGEGKVPKSAIHYYEKLVPLAYGYTGMFFFYGLWKKILFSLLGLFRPMPREPATPNDIKLWAVKTASLACENIMLAFRAYGYDSCPMEGYDSNMLKKILNLHSGQIPVMVISAGKRAPNGVYGPRVRFDSSNFIKEI